MSLTVEQIVAAGLCIGCGLCRAIAGPERIEIAMTAEGCERPRVRAALEDATLERINAVCPGTRVDGAAEGARSKDAATDLIWGPAEHLAIGYAGNPDIRYRGSTGGALTALGGFLLESGRAKFILHVAASKSAPMRSERNLSFDAASVLDAAGS